MSAPESRGRGRELAFRVVPTVLAVLMGVGIWSWWTSRAAEEAAEAGRGVNQRAFEAAYVERGEPIPADGPREGYWGSRLGAKQPDTDAGWRESQVSVPGLVEIAANGTQELPCGGCETLLISGGSVGFGAYASSEDATWFAALQRRLVDAGAPVRVVVFAAGAWKAEQEAIAIRRALPHERPARVLMMTGLNDLTNGYTAADRFGTEAKGLDGEALPVWAHAGDWEARVEGFTRVVADLAAATNASGAELVAVLQPGLFSKEPRSALEDELLTLSARPWGTIDGLAAAYDALAEATTALDGVTVIDCRAPFQGEAATTFADLWHFADHGHRKLADCVADGLAGR